MGLNYSINLYFPQQQLKPVLKEIAELSDANSGPWVDLQTRCLLPDGSTLHLPFSSDSQAKSMTLQVGGPGLELDTCLLFPIEDYAIEEYLDWYPFKMIHIDPEGFARYGAIGRLYLTVTVGLTHVEFSIEACTTSMSRLLIESSSVRDTFSNILQRFGGLYGLIDTDQLEDCMLLSDPLLRLHVCRMLCYDHPFKVDEFVGMIRLVSNLPE